VLARCNLGALESLMEILAGQSVDHYVIGQGLPEVIAHIASLVSCALNGSISYMNVTREHKVAASLDKCS
jgi:hypothetical protein